MNGKYTQLRSRGRENHLNRRSYGKVTLILLYRGFSESLQGLNCKTDSSRGLSAKFRDLNIITLKSRGLIAIIL